MCVLLTHLSNPISYLITKSFTRLLSLSSVLQVKKFQIDLLFFFFSIEMFYTMCQDLD